MRRVLKHLTEFLDNHSESSHTISVKILKKRKFRSFFQIFIFSINIMISERSLAVSCYFNNPKYPKNIANVTPLRRRIFLFSKFYQTNLDLEVKFLCFQFCRSKRRLSKSYHCFFCKQEIIIFRLEVYSIQSILIACSSFSYPVPNRTPS
jgi:hypothetical protein